MIFVYDMIKCDRSKLLRQCTKSVCQLRVTVIGNKSTTVSDHTDDLNKRFGNLKSNICSVCKWKIMEFPVDFQKLVFIELN